MRILGWWKKAKKVKDAKAQPPRMENDICPECGGQGYILNDNHYLTESEDYERNHPTCRRCHGTGYYRSDYR